MKCEKKPATDDQKGYLFILKYGRMVVIYNVRT